MNETEQLIQQLKILQIQETQIINRLEELATTNTEDKKPHSREPFEIGDRVKIKNRITASSIFTRVTVDGDRNATVTATHTNKKGFIDKVYILTDNGLATHRLPKNIELLKPTT